MSASMPSATSLAGQMLIAMPAMGDSRFAHAVIFLCAHSAEGALGIIVNQPLATPRFAELLSQLEIAPNPPARHIAVRTGGPVETSRGFVLHSTDWQGEGTMQVCAAASLTASLDVLRLIAEGQGPRTAMLALGYAGWGPGQLDGEIQANAWLTAPADAAILFDDDDATKWHRALASLRVDPAWLSGEAGRA
jgi:putative transcriptional regulator